MTGCRSGNFFFKIISHEFAAWRRAKHLYEQHKSENADCCLPALGAPLDAKPRVEHAGSPRQVKLLNITMEHSGRGVDGTLSTCFFGPRISYRSYSHFTPFAETLFGGAHEGVSLAGGASGSQNALAMAIRAGLDYRINDRFSLRPPQVDYLMTRFPEELSTSKPKQSAGIDGAGDSPLRI